jgi:hypothetical protein
MHDGNAKAPTAKRGGGAPFIFRWDPVAGPRLRQKRIAASDRAGKSVREPAAATPALRLDAPAPGIAVRGVMGSARRGKHGLDRFVWNAIG